MSDQTFSPKYLQRKARKMLRKVDSGYYHSTDLSENIDRKKAPELWSQLRKAWVTEVYAKQAEFWHDARIASGLKGHPQEERVIQLVKNSGIANTYEKAFRLLLDMASIALNTDVIGYNVHTGTIC